MGRPGRRGAHHRPRHPPWWTRTATTGRRCWRSRAAARATAPSAPPSASAGSACACARSTKSSTRSERRRIKRFFLTDDNFGLAFRTNPDYIEALFKALAPLPLQGWTAQAEMLVSDYPDLLALARRAHLDKLFIGFESVNPDNRQRTGRQEQGPDRPVPGGHRSASMPTASASSACSSSASTTIRRRRWWTPGTSCATATWTASA